MCLKVIENGKHKDVHIKEGEVSFRSFTCHFSRVRKSGELGGNKTAVNYIKSYISFILLLLVCL